MADIKSKIEDAENKLHEMKGRAEQKKKDMKEEEESKVE